MCFAHVKSKMDNGGGLALAELLKGVSDERTQNKTETDWFNFEYYEINQIK